MSRKPRVSAAMVGLMSGGERHAWTLEELHSALVERGHPTDFSSVFRAAEKLAVDGIVRKLLLDDGRARFELSSAHHDHLYCTQCRRLVPVPCPVGSDEFAALERETGIAVLDHHLILNGLCRECREGAAPGGSHPT
ncbi:MAG: Fur family transcriptional regulator [Alphaproteobacteria bacterium]